MNEKEMALLVHYTMRNHIGAMALNSEGEEDGYMRLYKTMKEERRHATTIFRKLRSAERDLDKLLGKEGKFKHVEYKPYNEIKDNRKTIQELERQLNEEGYLMASELGWPPTTWDVGFDILDSDYEIVKVLDDGHVLIDYKGVK